MPRAARRAALRLRARQGRGGASPRRSACSCGWSATSSTATSTARSPRCATAGYRQVEVKLLHGRTAPAFRAALDRLGLVAPGLHADLLPLRAGLDSLLGDAQALGAEYVALAWYGEAERPASRDGWLRLADEVNGFGRQAQARGLQFAYHNHAFEFADAGGEPAYDVLLGALDPDLVTMQIDHYWVTKAGYDPADYLTRYPGRFPLWHLKDAAGAEQRIAAVGSGAVDWPRLFALAGVAGLRYAFVDAEDTGRDLDTARESLAYLDTLR